MRYALCACLLLTVPVFASDPPTIAGVWVGPLEADFPLQPVRGTGAWRSVRSVLPTRVELTQEGDQITGRWMTLPPNQISGLITGHVTVDGIRLTIVIRANSAPTNPVTGAILPFTLEPEACQGRATINGVLTRSRVMRWTGDGFASGRQADAEGRACVGWPQQLVWTLQPH